MADINLPLVNPGAESNSTTGWTIVAGSWHTPSDPIFPCSIAAHGGTRYFTGTISSGTAEMYQDLDVSAYAASIDAGTCSTIASAYRTETNYQGRIYVKFINALGSVISTVRSPYSTSQCLWLEDRINTAVPANTRTIRIGAQATPLSAPSSFNFDDFSLIFVDTYEAYVHQAVMYGIVTQPAQYLSVLQAPLLLTVQGETSSGEFHFNIQQAVMYALVKKHGDKRKLRAWTFTQDDHDFYVVQLGSLTLVYDKLTRQWSRWKSPSYNYWRGEDGRGWEGFNVCCDTETGKIWKIDAEGRLDTDGSTITPITSTMVGQLTERFRTMVPCFMAELAVSEGQPPSGVDAGEAYLQLRTSSDGGQTFTDHGNVLSTDLGEDITVRWYGLGLMKAPGQVFEITDTGYARRIDGFNIEVPGQDQ